ncbi:hypothetical protein [Desulfoscipio geothermicus]|uniref:hypothetical protein n=1 Tax=Desulfoscipio geothermicus TaxID=39060 RepID=UPI000B859A88|nr:hypothetical protein [Desulfoscipio geothermicus]
MPKNQLKNLQIVDSLASATFEAFEPNEFGDVEPAYILKAKKYFYVRNGNLFSYGLKLFPDAGNSKFIQKEYPWLRNL